MVRKSAQKVGFNRIIPSRLWAKSPAVNLHGNLDFLEVSVAFALIAVTELKSMYFKCANHVVRSLDRHVTCPCCFTEALSEIVVETVEEEYCFFNRWVFKGSSHCTV